MLRPFWFANSQALDDPQGDSNKNEKRNTPVYLSIFIKKGFFPKVLSSVMSIMLWK